MQVIETIEGVRKALDAERHAGRTVGLVPTMGYLHAGHRSLIERAAADNDVVAVTLFVNPLQFAPTEDLAAYPRDLPADQALATEAGAGYLFAPSVEEMYGAGSPLTAVNVARVSEPMEGRARPTHFAGVATVVAKLFAIAGPCRAYFGEKDYQQLAVIRRMVVDLSLPVEVVGCPTVREADGLALSSRNVYLTPEERAVAPLLHRALIAGRAAIEAGERDPAAVRRVMHELISAEPRFTLDYAEVVDAHDLSTPTRLSGDVRLLVAARLGKARLIDNTEAVAISEADQIKTGATAP
ncbi:MAG TPA: pantoate--beta-alanine ligase [Acidimicrobiales bacterium]|nr:pantoate--beta-alanine ligase [Acidimicrobiales bacterium]